MRALFNQQATYGLNFEGFLEPITLPWSLLGLLLSKQKMLFISVASIPSNEPTDAACQLASSRHGT